MKQRALVFAAAVSVCLLLGGCGMSAEPSLDEVRGETRDVMQQIVDQLPSGTTVDDRSKDDDVTGCSGDGVAYIGHWVATPGARFDGKNFVDALPNALGDEFDVDEDAVEVSVPAVSLDSNGMVFDVMVVEEDGVTVVDVFAVSRCGATPAG